MTYAVQFRRKDGSTGLVGDSEAGVTENYDTREEAEAVVQEMYDNYKWTGLEYSVVNSEKGLWK